MARWKPIATADPDKDVLLWTPAEALYEKPRGREDDIRVSSPRFWTWATHWQPLPSPPGRSGYKTRKARGLCPDCGAPADNGHTYCAYCIEQKRTRRLAARDGATVQIAVTGLTGEHE